MRLFSFALRHRKALLAALALLLAATAFAVRSVPVSLFPAVSFPRVVVRADAGDRPAEQVVLTVTRPLEQAVSGVPGLRRLRSTTSRGTAEISANFAWGVDMRATTLLVQSAVSQAFGALPAGTTFTVQRMDPSVFPVIGYSLTSPSRSQADLRELAQERLRPALLAVPGVAAVEVLGGAQRELRVTLDPEKLRARSLPPQAALDALARANTAASGGLAESRDQLALTLVEAEGATPEALAALPIAGAPDGQPVLLGEVAVIAPEAAPRWTRVRADGREAVLLNVYQQPGGNTLAIGRGVAEALAAAQAGLPRDARVRPFYDQGELIQEAMGGVRDAIVLGMLLGVGVIGLFLRQGRATLLASLAVPTSLGLTLLGVAGAGLSFDVMTLGGLAAAVGLVLDDAIVMIERVTAGLEAGEAPLEASRGALVALRGPFVASSLCSMVVFAPLAFLDGVAGAFFRSLSLTMAMALAASLALTLVVLPPLAARVLRPAPPAPAARSGPVERVVSGALRRAGRRPALVAAALAAMLAGAAALYATLPNGFLPPMDEGAFVLDYVAPAGASLARTERLLAPIDAVLSATPEVASYSRRTGLALGGGLTEANAGDYLVKLKPGPRRSLDAVIEGVRARIAADAPGVETEFVKLMEDLVGDLTAVPQPIEILVKGEDLAADRRVAEAIAAMLPSVQGVVDVFDGQTPSGPSWRFVSDPMALGRYGLTSADVGTALQLAVGGVGAPPVLAGSRTIGVRAVLGPRRPDDPAALAALLVALPDGRSVPLGALGKVEVRDGEPQIAREGLQAMVAVTARLEGQGLSQAVDRIRARIAGSIPLPPGVSVSYGGLYLEQQASFNGLLGVIAGGFALVALVLVSTFGSFGLALAVLAVDAASLFGVALALGLTGTAVDLASMMGAVMIVGIVAENAVFLLHDALSRHRAGAPWERALEAAVVSRARPVAMTTLAAVLALAPLALGMGAGAQLQRPLAIAVMGGFGLSALLILVALPALARGLGPGRRAAASG